MSPVVVPMKKAASWQGKGIQHGIQCPAQPPHCQVPVQADRQEPQHCSVLSMQAPCRLSSSACWRTGWRSMPRTTG